jgi:hypothetical protein
MASMTPSYEYGAATRLHIRHIRHQWRVDRTGRRSMTHLDVARPGAADVVLNRAVLRR